MPPLKVFSDNKCEMELAKKYEDTAADLGVTLAQYLGMIRDDEDLPFAGTAYLYEVGKPPLSSCEEIAKLSTKQ